MSSERAGPLSEDKYAHSFPFGTSKHELLSTDAWFGALARARARRSCQSAPSRASPSPHLLAGSRRASRCTLTLKDTSLVMQVEFGPGEKPVQLELAAALVSSLDFSFQATTPRVCYRARVTPAAAHSFLLDSSV